MHDDHDRDPSYVSQSEGRCAQDCGTKWLAEWHHGIRHVSPESPPQIIGSLGHAVVGETLRARHEKRDTDTHSALLVECEKRRYAGDLDDMPEVARAEQAAETLLHSPKVVFGPPLRLPDGRVLIDKERMRATWATLARHAGLGIGALASIFAGYRVGMEGQADYGHVVGRTAYIDDFKFRQKADLGGAEAQSGLPDSQGSYYKVLMRAVLEADAARYDDIVFRQINVYAGPWLALDDFLCDGSEFITAHGIPSRDLKVTGMVAPEVWEEAWRVLVERRRVDSLSAVTRTKAGKVKAGKVKVATDAEMRDAAAHVEALRRVPLVEVSEFRGDHTVCVEVVRDMLAAVAGHIALIRAGTRPGRHLRTYPTSPCARRFGCPVQDACLSSLGTGRLEEQLADMAEDGRLRRTYEAARSVTVADYDAAAGEAVAP